MFISHISEFCHKHARIAFAFLFVAIVIPFVFMDAMTGGGGGGNDIEIGEMFGDDIDLDEYRFQAQASEMIVSQIGPQAVYYNKRFGMQLPAPWTHYATVFSLSTQDEAVRADALKRLVLINSAKEQELDQVTAAEMSRFIKSIFGGENFNEEQYKSAVKASGIKTNVYEEMLKETLIITRVLDKAAEGVVVSDKEVRSQYNTQNASVEIAVNSINSGDFAKDFVVTEEAVKKHFNTNKNDYEDPAQKILNLVEFKIQGPTTPELQAYFDKNKADFVGTHRKASHIIITFDLAAKDKDADKKAKKIELAKIHKEISDKKITFEDAAKKYSKDSSKFNGGSLGWVVETAPGSITKPVIDKIFEMEKGKLSDIVESVKGFHIIRLDEDAPVATSPMVGAAYKTEVAIPTAKRLANSYRVKFRNAVRRAAAPNAIEIFTKMAKEQKLAVQTTEAFDVGTTSFRVKKGVAVTLFDSKDPETAKMISALGNISASTPTVDANIKANNGSFLVCCFKEGIDAEVPKYEDAVMAQRTIRDLLKYKEQMAKAKIAAEKLYKVISTKVATGLTDALKAELKLEDIKSYKLNGGNPSGVVGATEVAAAVAKATPGQLIAKPIESTTGFDIVYVVKRTIPSDADFAKEQVDYKRNLLSALRSRNVHMAVKKLQDDAEIKLARDEKEEK